MSDKVDDGREDALRFSLEKMRRHINNMPELLFEWDGYIGSSKTDNVFADLYGMDEELIVGGMRLPSALPVVRMPIRQRLTVTQDDVPSLLPRVAEYVQQNTYARMTLAAEYAPSGLTIDPVTYSAHLLLLRYKRRL